jgi:hypothetical protein
MEEIKNMEIKTIKALKKETKPVSDVTAEWEELKETTEPISGFENVPTVSVADKDIVKVEFLSEPQERTTKDGKAVAYAEVKLLAPHLGYDREKREEIPLEVGAKAAMNMKRHATLWKQAQANAPLKGKKFTIGIVGTLPSKKGQPAKDYRWKPIAD